MYNRIERPNQGIFIKRQRAVGTLQKSVCRPKTTVFSTMMAELYSKPSMIVAKNAVCLGGGYPLGEAPPLRIVDTIKLDSL